MYWSIGYIDLSYQFNTPEYHQNNLQEHLLKTYAKGGTFRSKSKTGFLVKFKKSIVSAHGKITYKLAELSLKDRICQEWCEHERIKTGGRYIAEITAIISGMILINSTEPHLVEKATLFFAGLFLKINKKLDDYCKCIDRKIKKKNIQKVLERKKHNYEKPRRRTRIKI